VYVSKDPDSLTKYSYSGTHLENCLTNINDALSNDVQNRIAIANDKLQQEMIDIEQRLQKVYAYSSYNASKS